MPRADKRQRKKDNARAAREAREAAARRRKRIRTVITVASVAAAFVLLILAVNFFTGGSSKKKAAASSSSTSTTVALPAGCVSTVPTKATHPTFKTAPAMTINPAKRYTATMTTSCGPVTIALDAKHAPKSVNNFVFLAKSGYFDGLKWNRAAKGFVIQTGSPNNTQAGGAGYSQVAELPPGGKYPAGAVAWAKTGSDPKGTVSGQWFIVTGNASGLSDDYGYIGTVSQGLANAQKIESLAPTSGDGPPVHDVYVGKVTITES